MPTFTPPVDTGGTPAVAADDRTSQAARLFRHFAGTDKGRNVWKLTDGTYTEMQPTDMDTVAVTYYGGHTYTVSSTEAAALAAAGYVTT